MIREQEIDQAFSDLSEVCGGLREDYFGLLYLEREYALEREKALNCVAFGGNDYGVDGFHYDRDNRNLYIFQFKYSSSHSLFKSTLRRLIDKGVEQIFSSPNKDQSKNQILLQLRTCLVEHKMAIEQVCFRFVFTGDPAEAERSQVLDKLREDLENKRHLIDRFFEPRKVEVLVDFRSASGRVGAVSAPSHQSEFPVHFSNMVTCDGPYGQRLYLGFIRLADLAAIHAVLGTRFFDRNIRYGLGESQAVNRALTKALRQIVIEKSEDPRVFAFNHNGITLASEKLEMIGEVCLLTVPRLLNGAQTVSTLAVFREANRDNPALHDGMSRFEQIQVLCKVITSADQEFVTTVTVNNNRQNPVDPWNLRANDLLQLELQDKLRDDLKLYYERQENAFDQLSAEDLEEYGIAEDSKAIQMLKLTQTFLLTDGHINRVSEMRRVFEDDKVYESVFRRNRLKADSRRIVLCYKVQFRLRKLMLAIEDKGRAKYAFISRARNLLWALVAQGLLNRSDIESIADRFGWTLSMPAEFSELLVTIATTRVRPLLSALMEDRDYVDKVSEGNLSFLRTDRAFEKCMAMAYDRWKWVHKKLQ